MGGGGLAYYDPAMLVRLSRRRCPPPPAEQVEKLTAEVAEAKKAWDAIRGTPEGLAKAAERPADAAAVPAEVRDDCRPNCSP